ncbi:hypothetical protein LA345_39190 (plasmid) [Burkholderia vietnamiensis]|uniref:Uncharacterized protein n=1 Tax=Burkholderia vietnamiensis (strain G4 / LMG 22486) TaxID=269482 RepID=A4JW86_BURVG|nr:conserved hypothetical protein [Burkholderia vietnamiensis G4]MCB4349826.1 hypothetical protein [Burkholderia vietnamiensis]
MNEAKQKPLKAYQVDHYEGPCEGSALVFAKSNAAARTEGASELGLGWDDVSAHRSAQFDHYAPGPVPIMALIDGGWTFHCHLHECQSPITREHHNDDGDEVDTAERAIVRGRKVFCDASCAAMHDASKRRRAAAEAALIELVEAKFPGCTITRIHICHDRLEPTEPNHGIMCSAEFKFPGAKYGATYIYGEGNVARVAQYDLEAFKSIYQ